MAIYQVIYDGPPRSYGSTPYPKRYVAIHNTSNDATARAEADYAKRRTDGVSSHYYADAIEVIQSLDTALSAHHAGSTTGNRYAISYEITGTNGKSREWWLANVAWSRLARQMAADCRAHGIEPRLLTVEEMRAGSLSGFVTHDLMRLAWGGTTHTDPGPGFPMDYLLDLVRAELDGDGMDSYTEAAIKYTDNRVAALISGKEVVAGTQAAPQGKGEAVWPVVALKLLQADVAELKNRPTHLVLSPEDRAAIVADLAALLLGREAAADRARADVLGGPVA